jgi:hypothetical protein
MKILLNIAIGNKSHLFNTMTKPKLEIYASKHNLEHVVYTEFTPGFMRVPHWFKIQMILDHLERGDEVLYLDADVSILNFDVFPTSEKDVGICKDSANIINTEVMYIKPTEFAKTFFKKIYNRPDGDSHCWYDNYAFLQVFEKELTEEQKINHFQILDNRFNVTIVRGENPQFDQYLYNECNDTPWFRHFAGGQPWSKLYF